MGLILGKPGWPMTGRPDKSKEDRLDKPNN